MFCQVVVIFVKLTILLGLMMIILCIGMKWVCIGKVSSPLQLVEQDGSVDGEWYKVPLARNFSTLWSRFGNGTKGWVVDNGLLRGLVYLIIVSWLPCAS